MGAEPEGADRPQPWTVVEEDDCGDFEMFRVRRLRARSPRDGSEHDFHVAEAPDGVTVIALTPDGRAVLVEQYRMGTRQATLETPSGIVDEGERPEEAAARELREETGYGGGAGPEVIGSFQINPSWQRGRVYVAVARGVERVGRKDQDAGEDTHVRLVPAADLARMAAEGEIGSAAVIAALALWRWREEGARG
ncbi:MAG TPA: NUDIX hydrolase [Longimicrobium sp.]|jgi:8-oxo-dGTP pyrophosphatase MutT (NUDIX family)